MNPARSLIVWAVSAALILAMFAFFALQGWPGEADSCVVQPTDKGRPAPLKNFECYCEAYTAADVGLTTRSAGKTTMVLNSELTGKPGIRQPVNTLSNLYALGTSFVVALVVYLDRRDKRRTSDNLMRGDSVLPDLYVFVVLFLGLGSMFFHASLKQWGGNVDGLSMYLYAGFLPAYTMRRVVWPKDWVFWLLYLVPVVVFFVLHIVLSPHFDLTSIVLLVIMIAAYVGAEVWHGIRTKTFLGVNVGEPVGDTWLAGVFHGLAVASFVVAVIFQLNSGKPGDAFCEPHSAFQPHGMLWHPLAGAMAVLLYFYWRVAKDKAN